MGLGTWQLYRLQWKSELMHMQQQAFEKDPVHIHQVIKNPGAYTWRQTVTEGEWESTTYFVIGRTHMGKAGYHALQAMRVKGQQQHVLINRGWVPHKDVTPAMGSASIQGVVRMIEEPRWWTPAHRLPQKELGYIDPEIIETDTRFYIAQTDTQLAPASLPILHNPHLEYAITWFLMGMIWLSMVGLYWWKYGRFIKVRSRSRRW